MHGTRFLFVTNECAGLGHLRRNVNLAKAVVEADPEASALIITGSAALGAFTLPARVDTVKLPVLGREADGTLHAGSLAVSVGRVESLRSQILLTTAQGYDPDVVIVDKTPLGLRNELVPMLEYLRAKTDARVVLG